MPLSGQVANEQSFGFTKPLRIIMPEAGGSLEYVAHSVGQAISGPLGQPVRVENHEVDIGIDLVGRAPADGRTLLLLGPPFWTGPLMQDKPYDPVRDFAPVTLATISPLIIMVHPSSPMNTLEDLINTARANPGKLKYGSGVTGTSSHLGAELFKSMADIDIVRVAYKGGGLALPDLIADKLQLMFTSAGSGMPFVQTGKVKALAVASAQPSALAPGIPTVAKTISGYEAAQAIGIFVRAGTPSQAIQRLNCEIVKFLQQAPTRQQMLHRGLEVIGSTPEELADKVVSEMKRLREVISRAGIRSD